MSTEGRTFFVTPGSNLDRDSNQVGRTRLTSEGIDQVRAAARQLIAANVGKSALLLSSDTHIALHSAALIAKELGKDPMEAVVSPQVREGGLKPETIPNVDAWIDEVLDGHSIERTSEDLIIVTHRALMARLMFGSGQHSPSVPFGHVHEYSGEANSTQLPAS